MLKIKAVSLTTLLFASALGAIYIITLGDIL